MMRGFVTAMRTLTILPCPGLDAKEMRASLPWFPGIGLLLGLLVCIPVFGGMRFGLFFWPEAAAAAAVAASATLTRGLHLDGLADWVDGFWGGRGDRTRTLAIMKDPHTGTFGQLALMLTILFQWVAITRLITIQSWTWIPAAFVISRTAQVYLAVRFPYARDEGGTGGPFIRDASWPDLAGAFALAGLLLLIGGTTAAFQIGWLLVVILAAEGLGRWCKRRIGGITGDILGAGSTLAETATLLTGAMLGG